MVEYIEEIFQEMPAELLKGAAATPAANHLFHNNPDKIKLLPDKAIWYHHLVAKLQYLCKHTRPDI